MHKRIIKKNKVGIKKLIVFPIPSITPLPTMKQVRPKNSVCQKIIFIGEPTNSLK